MKEFFKLAIVPFLFACGGLAWGWIDATSKGLPISLGASFAAVAFGTLIGFGMLALVYVATLTDTELSGTIPPVSTEGV